MRLYGEDNGYPRLEQAMILAIGIRKQPYHYFDYWEKTCQLKVTDNIKLFEKRPLIYSGVSIENSHGYPKTHIHIRM